ncbi:MAG: phosphotransferase family protein [Persicimonas sp.]
MSPTFKQRWLDHFRACGYPDATGIATGMEGAVYSLVPGELVAKVWSRRGIDSLRRLEAFYERLASTNGRLRTPRILDVDLVDGVAVSKEMFLPGVPLERHLTQTAKSADLRTVDATAEVLQFLRDIGEADEFRDVLVLDETRSAWKSAACWSDAIGQLLHRRLARFGEQLDPVVPHLDDLVEAMLAFLRTRDDVEMSVIHGDLCPANVMVDDTLEPVAVLDFGFLSTFGDPAFDVSIASAIFNMYGPNARVIDEQVVLAMQEALGYGDEVLLAYRAVYALLTSNAYASDGDDGHFRWCVEMLGRRDVRGALNM